MDVINEHLGCISGGGAAFAGQNIKNLIASTDDVDGETSLLFALSLATWKWYIKQVEQRGMEVNCEDFKCLYSECAVSV